MKKLYKFLGYLILILGAISMLLPFIYMICLSFMTDEQIFTGTVAFLPEPFTIKNYEYVIKNADIFNELSKKLITGPKRYTINFCLRFIFYSLFLE